LNPIFRHVDLHDESSPVYPAEEPAACRRYLNFRAYAFNPTPNDTNLEFDTSKNLLKKDTAPYLP